MNIFLEKIAEKQPRQVKEQAGEAMLMTGGAFLAKQAPSHLLGYHKVYHGTPSAAAARSIKEKGLRKSYGGTAGSVVGTDSERRFYTSQAKEHVYVTKDPTVAARFAGDSAKHLATYGGGNSAAGKAAIKQYLTGEGKVLKARVPHRMWEKNMEMDPDSFDFVTRSLNSEDKLKATAARSKKDIHSKYFKGGAGNYKGYGYGIKSYLNKTHLKDYYNSASGKARGLRGAGLLAGGIGAAALGAGLNVHRGGVLSKLRKSKEND